MNELPPGWMKVNLGLINEFSSQTLLPARQPDQYFELYSVPAFPNHKPELLLGADIGSIKQLVEPNDVLICKINPRINRVWKVLPKGQVEQIASSEWIVVRSSGLSSDFLQHYFSSPAFRDLLGRVVTGVGGSLTRAQPKRVAAFPVLIAPINEQKRIVDKITALLTRIETCRERLDRVLTLAKQLRQAILSAAISGRLTERWSGKNRADWTLERAATVCEKVQNGGTPREGFVAQSKIPFLKVYNIVNQTVDFQYKPQLCRILTPNGISIRP
ncbi:hypothetical protein ACFQ4C_26340 [Larkinella insperata]|uniref:Type I restriction modification DNA specificity domain-containing protein n=1 Tax=Larkinella insperata TaxID=332158 RepID=A0ABW3QGV4_9BACT|nr:hypothetical protein [Larkinella insperata]